MRQRKFKCPACNGEFDEWKRLGGDGNPRCPFCGAIMFRFHGDPQEVPKHLTVGGLLDKLINIAKEYAPDCLESIQRNSHMNDMQDMNVVQPDRKCSDAIIVDFINFVAAQHCVDLALNTKNLYKREETDSSCSKCGGELGVTQYHGEKRNICEKCKEGQ